MNPCEKLLKSSDDEWVVCMGDGSDLGTPAYYTKVMQFQWVYYIMRAI